MTFGARLREAMDARGPLCAGIDPHPALLDAWGLTDSAVGLERFALTAVEALAGSAAAVKPQSAFFERHGAKGVAVLEKVVEAARQEGVLVILDVKRGDIGSTAQAYADAYLDPSSPLAADAVTVSPYLGFGSLDPLIDTALAHDAGVFVLALTSNPEGAQVQRARTEGGRTVAGAVLEAVAARNTGAQPMGSVGAVVGATVGPTQEDLDINGPLLAPGLGAQGATVADVRRVFTTATPNVLASSSRALLTAGPEKAALHAAARAMVEELAALRSP
jgi:orotidine-5'-phosphate decarboxylase